MDHPTLLSERPRNAQIALAALVPFAFGAVAGIVLGISAGFYWGLLTLAAIGGVLAGLEHETTRSAARRGLVGGALFASGLLIAHAITGADEKASLGSFPPLLIVIDAAIGAGLAVLGAWLRRRSA